MPLLESDPRVRLLKTAHVIYYHDNLIKAKQFLIDFGFQVAKESDDGSEVYLRGFGSEPYCYVVRQSPIGKSFFGGAAYYVESYGELEKATKVSCATGIEQLKAPGGGLSVTLTDPTGNKVVLVHGQEPCPVPQPDLAKLTVNYEVEKPRQGEFQRLQPGVPVPIFRWGHYGVSYPPGTYDTMLNWYTKHLTLAISDIVTIKGEPATVFYHIDRGLDYTEHHSFFMKRTKPGVEPSVAHAAFEVHDFDMQQIGHDYLSEKGYQLCWGVGRHHLGSQVFDYWFDPSGFIVEHYADGDLVNSKTPVTINEAGPRTLAQWGPPVPEVF